jgi:hypothetical protein
MILFAPLSVLLIGISQLYSLIIRLFFLPISLLKSIFLPPSRYASRYMYRGHGSIFHFLGIGRLLTVGVLIIIFFNRDLLLHIPPAWKPVLGGICLTTACISLLMVAKGFAKVILGAAFWLLCVFFISGAFFPKLHLSIKNNQIVQSFTNVSTINDLKKSNYRTISSNKDLLQEAGLKTSRKSTFSLHAVLDSVMKSLGLKENTTSTFHASPPFGGTKNAIPENAYFRTPKTKISNITSQNTVNHFKNWLFGSRIMSQE